MVSFTRDEWLQYEQRFQMAETGDQSMYEIWVNGSKRVTFADEIDAEAYVAEKKLKAFTKNGTQVRMNNDKWFRHEKWYCYPARELQE